MPDEIMRLGRVHASGAVGSLLIERGLLGDDDGCDAAKAGGRRQGSNLCPYVSR